ncbi:MAG: four helix bundle protein [Chitinophagales bacterium]|nr:four helix bundle protein [Chitinophagales bacterium]
MAFVHNYKDLKVWQKSRELVKDVYLLSATFPSEEKFGIVSQLRRAVISISNNLAEGSGRRSDRDFCRFLDFSYSSAVEVENILYLCLDLNFIEQSKSEEYFRRIEEIQKMIFSLRNKLEQAIN